MRRHLHANCIMNGHNLQLSNSQQFGDRGDEAELMRPPRRRVQNVSVKQAGVMLLYLHYPLLYITILHQNYSWLSFVHLFARKSVLEIFLLLRFCFIFNGTKSKIIFAGNKCLLCLAEFDVTQQMEYDTNKKV